MFPIPHNTHTTPLLEDKEQKKWGVVTDTTFTLQEGKRNINIMPARPSGNGMLHARQSVGKWRRLKWREADCWEHAAHDLGRVLFGGRHYDILIRLEKLREKHAVQRRFWVPAEHSQIRSGFFQIIFRKQQEVNPAAHWTILRWIGEPCLYIMTSFCMQYAACFLLARSPNL